MKLYNGYNKFTLIWSCGCILSNTVFENMQTNNECPNCNKKYKTKDLIDLNCEPSELESKRKNMVESYLAKKSKKNW